MVYSVFFILKFSRSQTRDLSTSANRQFFNALSRPVCLVNLDPAAPSTPYQASIDIKELITLSDVMEEFGLGPNGGMLYCLEFLEANMSWLEGRLKEQEADYFVFDLPGQVELSTNHQVGQHTLKHHEMLRKLTPCISQTVAEEHH